MSSIRLYSFTPLSLFIDTIIQTHYKMCSVFMLLCVFGVQAGDATTSSSGRPSQTVSIVCPSLPLWTRRSFVVMEVGVALFGDRQPIICCTMCVNILRVTHCL